jgi:hypothetical protein
MALQDKIRKTIAQEHRDGARSVGVPPSGGKRLEEVESMSRQPRTNNQQPTNYFATAGRLKAVLQQCGTPTNL